MRLVGAFLAGLLASLGLVATVVLVRHPLARYACHEAIQQDVEAIREAAFWRR